MSPLRLATLLSATLLASGCEVTSTLGTPCLLIKKADNGSGSMYVLKNELLPGQDFISFGATDCEDLICVRDAEYQEAGEVDSEPARGYCSKSCVEGVSDSCELTDSDVAPGLQQRDVSCRSLLLDQEMLDRLRVADPVRYRQTFGENNSPYFCAGNITSQQGG